MRSGIRYSVHIPPKPDKLTTRRCLRDLSRIWFTFWSSIHIWVKTRWQTGHGPISLQKGGKLSSPVWDQVHWQTMVSNHMLKYYLSDFFCWLNFGQGDISALEKNSAIIDITVFPCVGRSTAIKSIDRWNQGQLRTDRGCSNLRGWNQGSLSWFSRLQCQDKVLGFGLVWHYIIKLHKKHW